MRRSKLILLSRADDNPLNARNRKPEGARPTSNCSHRKVACITVLTGCLSCYASFLRGLPPPTSAWSRGTLGPTLAEVASGLGCKYLLAWDCGFGFYSRLMVQVRQFPGKPHWPHVLCNLIEAGSWAWPTLRCVRDVCACVCQDVPGESDWIRVAQDEAFTYCIVADNVDVLLRRSVCTTPVRPVELTEL